MKYLKITDFVTQTFIVLAFVISSIWIGLIEGSWSPLGLTFGLAILSLGWWQMISALMMLILKAPLRRQRLTHFATAVIYLAIVIILPVGEKHWGNMYSTFSKAVPTLIKTSLESLLITILIGVPIVLAIYYYCITWRWMFPSKSNGKFLPHISF